MFVTGNFVRDDKLRPLLERAIAEGHYVGPHSDSHPLYASWDERDKSLVTEEFFKKDLQKNIASLAGDRGLKRDQPVFLFRRTSTTTAIKSGGHASSTSRCLTSRPAAARTATTSRKERRIS